MMLLLVCNSFGVRVWEVIISIIFIYFGWMILKRSRAGKIKVIRLRWGGGFKGEDAKMLSALFAVVLLFLGVLVLIAAVLKFDC